MEKNRNTYHICLHGVSLDMGNMGVRALTHSLIKLLAEHSEDVRIQLLYGNRSREQREVRVSGKFIPVEVINFRLSPKAGWNEHLFWILTMAFLYRCIPLQAVRTGICRTTPWIHAIVHADIVGEINAGDSFSDIYGMSRYLIRMVPSFIVLLLNKPLVLLPRLTDPIIVRMPEPLPVIS